MKFWLGVLILFIANVNGGLAPACGPNARFALLLNTYFCLYEGLNSSIPLTSYCNYVNDGYIGYTFNSDKYPSYKCVAGSRQTGDYCLFEKLDLKPQYYTNEKAQPYCGYVQQGVIGFAWSFKQSQLVEDIFGSASSLQSLKVMKKLKK